MRYPLDELAGSIDLLFFQVYLLTKKWSPCKKLIITLKLWFLLSRTWTQVLTQLRAQLYELLMSKHADN